MKTGISKLFSRFIITLLAVSVLALAAYIPYTLQQHSIDRLNDQVATLRQKLNKQTTSSTSSTNPSTTQQSGDYTTYTSQKGVKIRVYLPAAHSTVASPLGVIGQVPGSWSFEASFPVKLVDANQKVIAQTTAHVVGNWMTSELTPFSAQLTYEGTSGQDGFLVLQKDNPSGLATNDDSVSIPVKF